MNDAAGVAQSDLSVFVRRSVIVYGHAGWQIRIIIFTTSHCWEASHVESILQAVIPRNLDDPPAYCIGSLPPSLKLRRINRREILPARAAR